MQTLFAKLASILIAPIVFVAGLAGLQFASNVPTPIVESPPVVVETTKVVHEYTPAPVQEPALGASLDIPTAVALFQTSLANSITTTATSMTLVSATDKDGNTMASSTYAFIIDEGNSAEEFVIADCTGTACTNMTRGVSVLTGTSTVSSLKKAHRRGASVKITDGPQLLILSRLLNGVGQIPNVIKYKSTTAACSANDDICDKAYVDGVAVAGASDANATTKGIVEQATAAEAAAGAADGSGNTTAPLALMASIATSTCQSAANRVLVASSTTGKLDGNCLGTDYSYNWTATTTISNALLIGPGKRLGIGTTTPYAPLSIVGETVGSYFTATSTTATSTFPSFRVSGAATTTSLTISGKCFGCANGLVSVTNTGAGPTSAGSSAIVTATCSGSMVVVGGGGSNTITDQSIILNASYGSGNTWNARYTAGVGGAGANTITAYAMCVNP